MLRHDCLWRSGFVLMKAESCTKPGYTRRMNPACGSGSWLIRFFSNQARDGVHVWDTFAIGEYLNEIRPGAGCCRPCRNGWLRRRPNRMTLMS